MKITDLPFTQHIGLEIDGKTVFLRQQDCLLNHVGNMHASVIHGLAESASGHFLILNLMPLFPEWLVLAKKATIEYKHPATNDCRAMADVHPEALQTCIDTLQRRKSAILIVPVKVFCGNKIMAVAEFEWWFRLNR